MEDNEANRLLHGENVVSKSVQFDNELRTIEEKHIEYFKSRPGRRSEHDHLDAHYIIFSTGNTIKLVWEKYSDLDEKIKTECIEAFKRVYPEPAR